MVRSPVAREGDARAGAAAVGRATASLGDISRRQGFRNDHELAAHVAAAAGRLLLALRADRGIHGQMLGSAGDAASNALILRLLEWARPADGVLSEESATVPAQVGNSRIWIIDPLDGTREYGEVEDNRADWAVHVALAENGRPTACAVELPGLGLTCSTARPPTMADAPQRPLKILVSRTRAPRIAEQVAAHLKAELVPMGSAGAKAMAVVRGEAHAYLHAGGQYQWDSCAPVGVAIAAGLHASRIDGSSCVYDAKEISMPDLLVCRPECARSILQAIATVTGSRLRWPGANPDDHHHDSASHLAFPPTP